MKIKIFNLLILFVLSGTFTNAQTSETRKKDSVKQDAIVLIINPVYNEIKVENQGTEFSEYLIYDIYGSEVKQGWFLSAIPVKSLSPGSYFLTINTKEHKIKMQFLKLEKEDDVGMLQ